MPDRVLVIDDDPSITQVISLLLKTHGFHTQVANSGQEGVDLVRASPPAAVILDLMMPGMDGWEVCSQLRTFSKVPILVLSAISDPTLIARARKAGANDYLIKPAPSELMISYLRKLIEQSRANL